MLNLQICSAYCILCLSFPQKNKEGSFPTPMTSDLNLIVELAFTCILWSMIVIYDLKLCLFAIWGFQDFSNTFLIDYFVMGNSTLFFRSTFSTCLFTGPAFVEKRDKSKNNPHALFTGSHEPCAN